MTTCNYYPMLRNTGINASQRAHGDLTKQAFAIITTPKALSVCNFRMLLGVVFPGAPYYLVPSNRAPKRPEAPRAPPDIQCGPQAWIQCVRMHRGAKEGRRRWGGRNMVHTGE